MKKFIQNKLKEQKGLTLIELLAVIVILAIIAAIAIPAIGNIIQNSREDALVADAQNVLAAANIYFTQEDEVESVDTTALISGGFLESEGNLSSATVTNTNPLSITFSGSAGNTTYTDITATAAQLSESGRDILEQRN